MTHPAPERSSDVDLSAAHPIRSSTRPASSASHPAPNVESFAGMEYELESEDKLEEPVAYPYNEIDGSIFSRPLTESSQLSVGDARQSFFNMRTRFKISERGLKAMYVTMQQMFPDFPSWSTASKYLDIMKPPVARYDACCCDGHIFVANQTSCPLCNQLRSAGKEFFMPSILHQLLSIESRLALFQGSDNPIFRSPRSEAKNNMHLEEPTIYVSFHGDGFSPWKSSYQIWPIILQVHNLNVKDKIRVENHVIAGMISGPKKPKLLKAFYSLVINEIKKLSRDGTVCRLKLLLHSCDHPALAKSLCHMECGAILGCPKCWGLVKTSF